METNIITIITAFLTFLARDHFLSKKYLGNRLKPADGLVHTNSNDSICEQSGYTNNATSNKDNSFRSLGIKKRFKDKIPDRKK
jgi:hypothetical protein